MAKEKHQALSQVSPYPIEDSVERLRQLLLGDLRYRTRYYFRLDAIAQDQYAFTLSRGESATAHNMERISSGILIGNSNQQTQVIFDPPDPNRVALIVISLFVMSLVVATVALPIPYTPSSGFCITLPVIAFVLGSFVIILQVQRSIRARIQREIAEVLGLSDEFSAF